MKISQQLGFNVAPILRLISFWETNFGKLGSCKSVFGPRFSSAQSPYQIGFHIAKHYKGSDLPTFDEQILNYWTDNGTQVSNCMKNVWKNVIEKNDTRRTLAERILNRYPPRLCPQEAFCQSSNRINIILDGSTSISKANFKKMKELSSKILFSGDVATYRICKWFTHEFRIRKIHITRINNILQLFQVERVAFECFNFPTSCIRNFV